MGRVPKRVESDCYSSTHCKVEPVIPVKIKGAGPPQRGKQEKPQRVKQETSEKARTDDAASIVETESPGDDESDKN